MVVKYLVCGYVEVESMPLFPVKKEVFEWMRTGQKTIEVMRGKAKQSYNEAIEMDRIYRNTPLEEIPWNIETPPNALVELVESGKAKPCKTIDLGCGTGNYAIYLATIGFEITGIDISPTAIKIAKENAKKKGVKCNFLVADVLGNLDEVKETFDFAYDWELLHHIFPEKRKKYVENVYRILNPRGKYLSVCFSEKDPQFGGSGKYRQTRLGTILYFSSEDELRHLFEPYFNIKELKTIGIRGQTCTSSCKLCFYGEEK